jgi:hypothetical protein
MQQHEDKSDGVVEVTYSVGDIMALNLVIWPFWASVIAVIAALLVLVPMILLLISGYPLEASIKAFDWSFTGLVLLILIGWLIAVSVFGYAWRRWKGLHGPILFALSEAGVTIRNRQMEGVVYWDAIKSVMSRGGRIFVFINRKSALIIPRRAFGSDAEFEDFGASAEASWKLHHRL